MKTKKIYLIRHGQTDYNLKGIVQGSGVDTDLNETGRCQALAFYKKYSTVPFDKIYTSALKRTEQSVQHFIDSGIPFESHPELNEISWGNKDGQLVTMEGNNEYLAMVECWNRGELDKCMTGGETPLEVQERQKSFIRKMLARPEEQTILICMHGRAIRIFLSTLLNYDLRHMDQFDHNNLGLYILNYSGSTFSVELHNNTEHLKDFVC